VLANNKGNSKRKINNFRNRISVLASLILFAQFLAIIPAIITAPSASASQTQCAIGASASCPATSPQEIYNLFGTTDNGTYYLNVNGVATQVYLLMNRNNSDNGGWVLLMKGTKSSSNFAYNSDYFTSNSNILNEASLTNDVSTDAKFSVYNNLGVNKLLAVFKDPTRSNITATGAGKIRCSRSG